MAESIVLNKEITEDLKNTAKNTACKIDNSELRKRAYALNIAADAVADYLSSKGLSVDTKCSLYKVPEFAKNLELADVYVDEKRLDVRVTFDEKIFYIPKIQEKYDAQPCAYLITKLDSSLDNVKILGFIPTDELEKQQSANEYYCYETSILRPISELENYVITAKAQKYVPAPDEIEKIKELAVSFIDDEISESEKVYFIKSVVRYALCREILCEMNGFDNLAGQISNYEELLNDSTLSVLSGNEKEVEEALLANISTVENAEENFISDTEAAAEEILGDTLELPEAEPMNLELEEEFADGIQPDATIENFVEEEEIIKPMSVLSLEAANNQVDEEPVQELQTEEAEIEAMALVEEDVQDSLVAEEDELLLTEDSTETVADVELEPVEEVADLSLSVDETEEPAKDFSDASLELADNDEHELELAEHEEEDNLLLSEDNDDLLLSGAADLLEEEVEKEVEEEAPVAEEPVERKPFSISLEGEDDLLEEESEKVEETENAEPVSSEMSFDNLVEEKEDENVESTDLSELDSLSELSSFATDEETVEAAKEEQNTDSEIQNLLDDDLMAILSDGNEEVSQTQENFASELGSVNESLVSAEVQETAIASSREITAEENFVAFSGESTETLINNENNSVSQEDSEIGALFEGEGQAQNGEQKPFELAQEPVSEKTVKATKNIIVLVAIFLLLVGGSVASWFVQHAKTSGSNSVDTANQDNEIFDMNNNAGQSEDQVPALSQDINKSMTNSFSDTPAAITITKLSWQVSEKLASENSVKEYLQTAGKNIQINLQNDLANSADINFNNSLKVSFEIAPDNTMKGMQVLESSGSDQVDEIVLRSIKNTLKYVSVPKLQNNNSDFFLTLIINF